MFVSSSPFFLSITRMKEETTHFSYIYILYVRRISLDKGFIRFSIKRIFFHTNAFKACIIREKQEEGMT
ncbi:hypothetical protein C6W18_05845 [Bacillus sp. LLTC93]|uniref:Uncharacterized protein n=1 Tax=Bacillus zhangzhouensis TaxID=1178540 RepID=A0A081LGF6_9BACI|nr:hypothetical protein BA70_01695 [Bacillus zhangzhouensis]PRO41532.1 hypothetical protein C6W18_05845 [Bacillus sp. LLTC93]